LPVPIQKLGSRRISQTFTWYAAESGPSSSIQDLLLTTGSDATNVPVATSQAVIMRQARQASAGVIHSRTHVFWPKTVLFYCWWTSLSMSAPCDVGSCLSCNSLYLPNTSISLTGDLTPGVQSYTSLVQSFALENSCHLWKSHHISVL